MTERFTPPNDTTPNRQRAKAVAAAGALAASLSACAALTPVNPNTANTSWPTPKGSRIEFKAYEELSCQVDSKGKPLNQTQERDVTGQNRHGIWEVIASVSRLANPLYIAIAPDSSGGIRYEVSTQSYFDDIPTVMQHRPPRGLVYESSVPGSKSVEVIATANDVHGNRINGVIVACGNPAAIPQNEVFTLSISH